MARRRQLEIPSADALREMEEGFARETARTGMRPPIADVVADAARRAEPLPHAERAEVARNRADAETLRAAREKGLVAQEVPISEVAADALSRDRMELEGEDLDELIRSIAANGLRLPIEVFTQEDGSYALVSGYRRLAAFRHLNAEHGGTQFATIPAFVRPPKSSVEAIQAMIEENEIRVGLSQYERGRVAAMAVHGGVFPSLGEAVKALYPAASKAKRSKIGSFALIHDELGDMLSYPKVLSERQCLKLAGALKAGQGAALREALEASVIDSAEAEWSALLSVIDGAEKADDTGPDTPKRERASGDDDGRELGRGVRLKTTRRGDRVSLTLSGNGLTGADVDWIVEQIEARFSE